MNGAPGRPQLQTLGERILSLSTGDPCPCCGARLEAEAGPTGPVKLACLECGCEIEADEEPFGARGVRALGAAA